MENINEPLMSARDFFRKTAYDLGFKNFNQSELTNSNFWLIITTAMESYSESYSKYHLNNVKEVVCDEAKTLKHDLFNSGNTVHIGVVDKQSITNAFDNYITNNLK